MKPTLDNYKDLVWTEENVSHDDYFNFFENLHTAAKLEFLKFLLKNYPEYDSSWIEFYFDIRDELDKENDKETVIEFTDFLREECPTVYKKEFSYLDRLPIAISIYKNDLEKLKKQFTETVNNPAKAIDDTMRFGFNILSADRKFWDYTKSVAQQVWQPLRDADNLIGAAEFDYSLFLYCDYLEQAFDKIKNGEIVDWELFKQNVEEIDFKYVEELESLPETDYEINWQLFHRRKAYRNEHYMKMMFHALYSIYVDTGIPTYWVFRTWMDLRNYMLDDDDASSNRKNWFAFTPLMIDRFGGKLNGFLGGNQVAMTIETFTIPYLYDYFLKMNFIDQALFDDLMLKYDAVRRTVIKIATNDLWRYAALYAWQKPSYLSEERFEAEKALTHNSFDLNYEDANKATKEFIASLPELPKSTQAPPPKPNPMFDLFGGSSGRSKPKRDTSKPKKQRKKKPKNNRKAGKKGKKRR